LAPTWHQTRSKLCSKFGAIICVGSKLVPFRKSLHYKTKQQIGSKPLRNAS